MRYGNKNPRLSEDNINIEIKSCIGQQRRLSGQSERMPILVNKVVSLGFRANYVRSIVDGLSEVEMQKDFEVLVAYVYDRCVERQLSVKKPPGLQIWDDDDFIVEDETNFVDRAVFPIRLRWFSPLERPRYRKESQASIQVVERQYVNNQEVELQQEQRKPHLKGPHFQVNNIEQEIMSPVDVIKKDSQIQDAQQPTKNCMICFGNIAEYEMRAVASCNHLFCMECVVSYLEDCIKTSNVMFVSCPMEKCRVEYTEEIIKSIVNIEMWEKFQRFKRRKIISQDPNVRWCPKPDCEYYVTGSVFNKRLVCQCGQEICFDCGNPDHPGLTCENALDELYLEAKKQYLIYPCPRCKSPIQKNSGCNHMTCQQCHHQFCWICMGSYSKIHYTIWNFCGCIIPGGQFTNSSPWKNANLWRIMMILPKLIGIILLTAILLFMIPFILIFHGMRFPYVTYKALYGSPFRKHNFRRVRSNMRCYRYKIIALFFTLGLILLPISITIMIIPFSCILLYREVRYRF